MPKKYSTITQGEWNGKVLVRDKRTDHSGIINIAIKAVNRKHLRIDLTSAMGTYLGSVAINGRRLDYLSIDDRTIYHMWATPRAVRSILKIPVAPPLLFDVLFDEAPIAKNWQCQYEHGYLRACYNRRERLKILWLSRRGDSRTIEIDHPRAEVQMDLYNFKAQISNRKTVFVLKAPPSFKVKNLVHRQTSRSETIGRN